ncbi:MAG: DUF1552 domain-containing protein [Pseudomonadota bacterium]
MITSKNRITRRTILRGAGHVAIALPFLEAMLRPRETHAQAATVPTRFVVFYSPGGTLIDKWRPTGTETTFTLSDMMAPLAAHQKDLLLVDGLNLAVTALGVGHPHSKGMAGVLTGTELLPGTFVTGMGSASFANGPSVDQIIAGRISEGLKFKSLEFSTAWAISGRNLTDGAVAETSNAANTINFAGANKPLPPMTKPQDAFTRIFSELGAPSAAGDADRKRTVSILDAVQGEYKRISAQLGPADKAKLDEHLAMVQQMEASLTATTSGQSCTAPIAPTTADSKDIPTKGRAMTDLLVASLACNLTRVATMQWGDSEAKFPLNFDPLQLPDVHHGYQHDSVYNPTALSQIYKWLGSNFAYLLDKLASVKEGDGTMLDNTVVLWVSEIQEPPTHNQTNMPFMIAGGKNAGIKTGRWLKVPSQPHNNLLVTLLNVFGGTDKTFGRSEYNTGMLAGLT